MSQKNNGYRLGLLARQKMREHGVEDSPVVKTGLTVSVGMLSALAWLLDDKGNKEDDYIKFNKKPEDGYNDSGPEGPGYYYNGVWIDD